MREILLSKSPGATDEYTIVISKFESAQKQAGGLLTPAKTRVNNIAYYQGYLPRLYQFWIKVDARPDPLLQPVALGVNDDIFIHNKGNFDTSAEKSIMLKAVNYSGKRRV